MRVKGNGGTYDYFYCAGREDHSCDLPYLRVAEVEIHVAEAVGRTTLETEIVSSLEASITDTLTDTRSATRERRQQLARQLAKIEVQENNLLDLAADGLSSAGKIRSRLAELDEQKGRVSRDLAPVEADLSAAAAYLRTTVQLLHNLGALYPSVSDLHRRIFNQAIFERFYVDADGGSGILKSPFAELASLNAGEQPEPAEQQCTLSRRRACIRPPANTRGSLADLLNRIVYVDGSGKPAMVEVRGIEPLASTVR
jgi:site-specific DNA recombinase